MQYLHDPPVVHPALVMCRRGPRRRVAAAPSLRYKKKNKWTNTHEPFHCFQHLGFHVRKLLSFTKCYTDGL